MSTDDNGAVELYRKHRPRRLVDVVGQPEAVAQLEEFVRSGTTPHATLFAGPSGVGKTTLARVLAGKIGCLGRDYDERNCADDRGIDVARDIKRRMGLAPMKGKCRVFVLDEVHRATHDAQSALLKMLEDTPSHVYFFLCTTDPNKLLPTVRTRCNPIQLSSLSTEDLEKLVRTVLAAEKAKLNPPVIEKLAEVSDGSARMALVLLHQVLRLPGETEQLAVLQKTDRKRTAYELLKALLWERSDWKKVRDIIAGISEDEDWEGLRRMVLSAATKSALKADKYPARALAVIDAFATNYFDMGKAGIIWSCSRLFQS